MDLNQDGNLDILSGSYSRMDEDKEMAGLFQVLWGEANGKFREATPLHGTDDQPLIAGDPSLAEINEEEATEAELDAFYSSMTDAICTRPTAADINADGHLDLIVGNASGTFYYFEGVGKGKFSPKGTKLETGKVPLRVIDKSDPCIVDWDQDGDLDILSGSGQGGVFISINTGTKSKPAFQPFSSLIEPVENNGEMKFGDSDIEGPQSSTRVWVADLNEDGKLDILVGDTVNLTYPAENLKPEDVAQKLEQWNKKMSKIQSEIQPKQEELFEKLDSLGEPNDSDDEETIAKREKIEAEFDLLYEEMEPLYEERSKIVRDESTGTVWVYYQK